MSAIPDFTKIPFAPVSVAQETRARNWLTPRGSR